MITSKPRKLPEVGCKVRDLVSTYGFRGGVEPMVGLAVQRRGLGSPSPLTIVLTVVAG
jgi:hypothetical protein